MTLLQHHLLGLALTSAAMLGFGLFLLFHNPKRPLSRSMALYCFSVAWWSGWECAALQMPTRDLAFRLMRIEYLGVVFIPTLFCATVSHLLGFSARTRRRLLIPMYVCSVASLFVVSIYPTRQFLWVSPGPVFYLPIWGWAGPHYWIFLTFFLGTILMGHWVLFRGWYRAKEQERIRLTLFLVGSVFAYLGGCPEFTLKYGIRLGWLSPYGLYMFPLYIGLLAYAVVQHQFFDIHIVIRRSLVYSILVTLLTIGYFGVVYVVERLFQLTFGYQSVSLSLTAFALMALAFQPLKIGIQRLVDRLLFKAPREELEKRVERLEQEAQQTEKLKAVATLAAGMAHEIKNPLSSIKTFVEYLPEKHSDPEFLAKFHRIVGNELEKIQITVQNLLTFAKPEGMKREPILLGELVQETLALLNGDCVKRRIGVEVNVDPTARVLGDRTRLKQALLNLCLNSLDAMQSGGRLRVAAAQVDGHLSLFVEDTGTGIAPQDLSRIFDPFFTTKPTGTGLGLSVVHGIVKEHGGTIHVRSQPGQGTTIRIALPT